VVLAEAGPVLITGLFAGVWVDRLRRRPVMISADLARAALLVSIPIAALAGALTMAHLYAVAAAAAAFTAFFDAAYPAYLPTLVGRENIVEGNAKLTASSSVAEMGGFAAAGALVQLLSGPTAILVDSVSYIVSAFSLGRIRASEPKPQPKDVRESAMREALEGLGVVWRDPTLRALIACSTTIRLSGGAFGAMYMLFAVRDLGLSPTAAGVIAATVFAFPSGLTGLPQLLAAVAVVVVPAILMVSTIRFRSFKTLNFGWKLICPMTSTKAPSSPRATKMRRPTLTSIERSFTFAVLSRLHRALGSALDELLDDVVRRALKIGRRAEEPDLPFVEHDDPGGDAENRVEIVRNDDASDAEAVGQLSDQFVDAARADEVEARGRLIEEHVARLQGEGAGDGDALFHAIAELGGITVAKLLHVDLLQAIARGDEGLFRLHPAVLAQRESDVLEAGHGVEQGRMLEDHRALLANGVHGLLVETAHLVAVEHDVAGVGAK